ncbi:MAG TPA: lyase family protein [Nocardioidaceae bacterium]|nr:lyase family protein [Nocardioidaceae bacterium]
MSGTDPAAEAAEAADFGLLTPATAGTAAEALTGDAAVLTALVRAEAALLRAQVSVGLLPAAGAVVADRVEAARATLDPRALALAAPAGGNPVIPLVAALREAVAGERPEEAGWIHRGATSQDVLDTALVLVTESVLERVEHDLQRLAGLLAGLVQAHRDTPMVARTLTQQALPSTLGLRLAGWLAGVHDALETVRSCRPLPASLSGPVGSASAFAAQGPAVLSAYAGELGLAVPVLGWHTRRHPVLAVGAALGEAGGACGKIAADVLVMAQTEVGEARESVGGTSSSMSHKANPVLSVLVSSAARQLAPLGSVLVASAAAEQERPAGAWHAEWQPLRGMLRLAGAAAEHTAGLVGGVAFDEAALRRNLDRLVEALGKDEPWVAGHTQAAGPWVDRVLAQHREVVG